MTPREQEEYTALRTTIRERGTARIWVFVVGTAAWSALTVATAALAPTPIATLLPLLILAAAFEAVFALHVGVERIGRYLQVFHDDEWERAALAFGHPSGAAAVDPLFVVMFALAAVFNVMPALLAQPTPPELIFIGGAHTLFLLRLVAARMAASKQRAIDLERFKEIKNETTTT